MKTVLITGCSSGYGLETARHFHAQGWNVVATMRSPREDVLPRSERLRVLPLDVTNTGPRLEGLIPEAYAPFAQRIFASFAQPAAVTTESDVAEVVWRAANDTTGQLRFPAVPTRWRWLSRDRRTFLHRHWPFTPVLSILS